MYLCIFKKKKKIAKARKNICGVHFVKVAGYIPQLN